MQWKRRKREEVTAMEEITASEVRARLAAGERAGRSFTLLDVREPDEVAADAIEGSQRIPLGEVVSRMGELDPARVTIVHCAAGIRSKRAIKALRRAGFAGELVNLTGGMKAWHKSAPAAPPASSPPPRDRS